MLLARLPEEARCWRDEDDTDPATWTLLTEVTAQAVDRLAIIAANHATDEPVYVPRPKRLSARPPASSWAEVGAFFGGRVRG